MIMKGNPIIQINSIYDSLHHKEKMIADVILKDPERVPYLSVAELAEQADTSYSSVVRFCKLIGYSGYSEFKTELAMYSYDISASLHYEFKNEDKDTAALVKNLLQTNCRLLENAAERLDYERLDQAADALLRAPIVYIFGNVYSGLNASTFQARLKSIGIPAFLSSDHIGGMQDCVAMKKGDVLLAISQSGFSKDTLDVARTAFEKGCTVIVLTTCDVSPIMEFCSIPLVFPKMYHYLIESYYSVELLFHAVLNILFLLLDARQNPEHRAEYENFFRSLLREANIDFNKLEQKKS